MVFGTIVVCGIVACFLQMYPLKSPQLELSHCPLAIWIVPQSPWALLGDPKQQCLFMF